MSRYIPVYAHPDRMPVDISFVFEDEVPAGKRGFCTVKGENMYFEDGTLAKFWGVMTNGAAFFCLIGRQDLHAAVVDVQIPRLTVSDVLV